MSECVKECMGWKESKESEREGIRMKGGSRRGTEGMKRSVGVVSMRGEMKGTRRERARIAGT